LISRGSRSRSTIFSTRCGASIGATASIEFPSRTRSDPTACGRCQNAVVHPVARLVTLVDLENGDAVAFAGRSQEDMEAGH
jgi:hypothetical protein